MQQPPQDARGDQLAIGDFVVYTTNAEGSSLQFGHIHDIKEKQHTDPRDGSFRFTHRIVVAKTDAFGNTKFIEEYDRNSRSFQPTQFQQKSGLVDHRKSKFLKL